MKLNKNYAISNVMDNTILINIKDVNSSIIKLNETSKCIVEGIIKGLNKEEIINDMLNKYDIDKDTLKKDYECLIERLKRDNIIDD